MLCGHHYLRFVCALVFIFYICYYVYSGFDGSIIGGGDWHGIPRGFCSPDWGANAIGDVLAG